MTAPHRDDAERDLLHCGSAELNAWWRERERPDAALLEFRNLVVSQMQAVFADASRFGADWQRILRERAEVAQAACRELQAEVERLTRELEDANDALDLAQQEAPHVESNVRATRDAEVLAMVEGMRIPHATDCPSDHSTKCECPAGAYNAALNNVAALLRDAKGGG